MEMVEASVAHHDPNLMSVGDQLAGDVRAEKSVGPDDELGGGAHFCPPLARIQAAASSSRVPSFSAFLHHFIPACRKRSGL